MITSVSMCVYIWRPEANLSVGAQMLSCIFETECITSPRLDKQARQTDWLVSPRHVPPHWAFYMAIWF